MDFFETPCYKLNKRLLSIIGHWPRQTQREKFFHQTFIIVVHLSIMIPEFIKLYEVWGDLEIIFDCIPPLGLHAINVVKWINCLVNVDKIKKLLTRIEEDWQSREDGNGSDILRNYQKRGKFLTVFYTCYIFGSAAFYVWVPTIPVVLDIIKPLNESRPREFFFRTEYFVDEDKIFVPAFFHALVTTWASITIMVAIDTMYGAYVQYACAIFAELGQQLGGCFKNEVASLNVSKAEDDAYHRIVKCVDKHKEAIEYCNLLESTYTVYFLVITVINIVLMSFTGVLTVLKLEDPKLAMRHGCYTVGQIVHVFFGCWHGQMLVDHSLRINDAIYNSKWYILSFRSRRLLTIMMLRSTKPCRLTAGKISFVCLETFSKIIRTAMSYFTVLRSLQ